MQPPPQRPNVHVIQGVSWLKGMPPATGWATGRPCRDRLPERRIGPRVWRVRAQNPRMSIPGHAHGRGMVPRGTAALEE